MKTLGLRRFFFCSFFLLATLSVQAVIIPLESRLGGLAYYDPNLDITWLADANINGEDNWVNQTAWAASLSIAGISGWRLPNADINDDDTIIHCGFSTEADCLDNEMGFLYYFEGISVLTPGPFSNIVAGTASNGAPALYWSSTVNFPGSNSAITFGFDGSNGSGHVDLNDYTYAWAVRDGDIALVSEPALLWLFGTCVLGLFSVGRRRVLI